MSNPVLVEVTRGSMVESRHRGMVVVVDGEGKTMFSAGEIEAPVFPRSAVKVMQALPLMESGAADAYGFGNRELALACASHSGEDEHVSLASSMLSRAGQGEEALECGAHWSFDQGPLIHQARTLSRPNALHNNCSGKHAGFVCAACHSGMVVEGYVGYDHPLQREIRGVMEALTGAVLAHDNCGTDGCSIPTYAVPLDRLADGFGRLLTGRGLEAIRARSARRLIEACMAEPFYVAGTRRFCTELMEVAPGQIFAKTGAEGVYCALLPDQGLSIAVKCEDGAGRAAECMVAATLARFFPADSETRARLVSMANHRMKNWNGIEVGTVRSAGALAL